MSSYANANDLVGKTVATVTLSPDRETLTLTCSDGAVFVGYTYGDYCSHSWIENIENEEALVGSPITAVMDIDMPDAGPSKYEKYEDVIAYYGLKLTTTKGDCIIDYRNNSNGYYGGSLDWSVQA